MIRISALEVSGFKSLSHATLGLSALNVLIGANGAGKSNLLSLFKLLNFAMSGILQLYVQRQGGASKILHHGPKHTQELAVRIDLASDTGVNSYSARWVHGAGDRLIFAEESITYRRAGEAEPYRLELGGGHRESALLEQQDNPTARFIRSALSRCRFYHFRDTSAEAPIKQKGRVNDNKYLRHDGGNLAAYLYRLQQTHAPVYQKIRSTIQRVAPFFQDFALQPTAVNSDFLTVTDFGGEGGRGYRCERRRTQVKK